MPRPRLMLVLYWCLRDHLNNELTSMHMPLVSFVLLWCLEYHLHEEVANMVFGLWRLWQGFCCLFAWFLTHLWLNRLILVSKVLIFVFLTTVVIYLVTTFSSTA